DAPTGIEVLELRPYLRAVPRVAIVLEAHADERRLTDEVEHGLGNHTLVIRRHFDGRQAGTACPGDVTGSRWRHDGSRGVRLRCGASDSRRASSDRSACGHAHVVALDWLR